jgi:hypothetical protein
MGGSKCGSRRGARRWSSVVALAAALMAVASGCAERPPAPLTAANGRLIVLGPEPGFDLAALPKDWFLAPSRTAGAFKVVDVSGIPVLRIEGSGGPLLGRRIAAPLLAAPYLHAGWYLDPALYNGGPRDGLPRGLRLVVGFKGGTPGGMQLIDHVFPGDLPAHDRFIELRLGGLGTARAEDAQLELAATSDRGVRRLLRPPSRGQAGHWHLEAIDLAALYGGYWPRDRMGQVEITFVAVGGLQHHPVPAVSGSSAAVPAGYVAEILLTR